MANCMMRIATDRSVNGMRILSSHGSHFAIADFVIGKSLMIVPRSIAKEGYIDIDKDDYTDDDGHDGYLKRTQDTQLTIIEDKWLDDYTVRTYKE